MGQQMRIQTLILGFKGLRHYQAVVSPWKPVCRALNKIHEAFTRSKGPLNHESRPIPRGFEEGP